MTDDAKPKGDLVPMQQAKITKAIKIGDAGIVLETVEDAINYCKWNQESGLLPEHIRNPKQAFAIMARGAELGLKPHASWRWLFMTKGGKIAMESKGKLAVCQAAPSFEGYKEWVENEDIEPEKWKAVAVAMRRGRADTIKEFSYLDAQRANLVQQKRNKRGELYDGTYQLYLKDMLLARARDRCLDLAFADVLGGMPSREIMEEVEDRTRREIRGVPDPVQATAKDPMLDMIGGAQNIPEKPPDVAAVIDPDVAEVIDAQVQEIFPPGDDDNGWTCECGTFNLGFACQNCGLKKGESPAHLEEPVHQSDEAEVEPDQELPATNKGEASKHGDGLVGVMRHPDTSTLSVGEVSPRLEEGHRPGDVLPSGKIVEEVDERGRPTVLRKAQQEENPFERGRRRAMEEAKNTNIENEKSTGSTTEVDDPFERGKAKVRAARSKHKEPRQKTLDE